jgi:hypothetical protein
MTSRGKEYWYVHQFLPPVVEIPADDIPAQDKPQPPPVQYEMFDYDE